MRDKPKRMILRRRANRCATTQDPLQTVSNPVLGLADFRRAHEEAAAEEAALVAMETAGQQAQVDEAVAGAGVMYDGMTSLYHGYEASRKLAYAGLYKARALGRDAGG